MKDILFKNILVFGEEKKDILISNGKVKQIKDEIKEKVDEVYDLKGMTCLPGFVDLHCHLREPGFEYKENIESGSKAAVMGGFTTICCMPNTNPPIDNKVIVNYVKSKAKDVNMAKIFPIGCVSKGQKGEELADIGEMKEAGIVAVSDDGKPVVNSVLMRLAMEYSADFGIRVISHCEDKELSKNGSVNEGYYSTLAGLPPISRASEEIMVAREAVLAETLDLPVHIAHISTKGSVEIIRNAKKRNVKITCETCPHYIAGTDEMIMSYDSATKVNPPLRTKDDVNAIIEGLKDGTIDAIATDHAPHHENDKNVEYGFAAFGISGFESAFPLLYTELVKTGRLSVRELSKHMTEIPAKILNLDYCSLQEGSVADLVFVDTETKFKIDSKKFVSKGHNNPFNGREVFGKIIFTTVDGEIKVKDGKLNDR